MDIPVIEKADSEEYQDDSTQKLFWDCIFVECRFPLEGNGKQRKVNL